MTSYVGRNRYRLISYDIDAAQDALRKRLSRLLKECHLSALTR